MKKFAILTNYSRDKGLVYTYMIQDYLLERGAATWLPKQIWRGDEADSYYDLEDLPEDVECIIVLGGDGTILKAARELKGKNLPIFSINLGTLGFLSSAEKKEIPQCLDCLLDDTCTVDERMMLRGRAYSGDELICDDIVLNDIVISREGLSRLVNLKVFVNEELLTIYEADGVIVSTPTGSTAYTLSAGGPIVFPQTDLIIITPICPHSLQSRSIVLSNKDHVTIEISRRRKVLTEEVIATYDGEIAVKLKSADRVEICRAVETVKLLRQEKLSFYDILQTKLGQNQG